jgi:transposase
MDRARLTVREQLVKAHNAMLGQLRGLLKLFGPRLGTVTTPGKRTERLETLFEQKPELRAVLAPLTEALVALETQIRGSSRDLHARAVADPVCRRLTSVPGRRPDHRAALQEQRRGPTALRA